MKKSPELRPTKYDALVVLAVLALALGLGARFYRPFAAEGALCAVISIDGRETERLPLVPTERTYQSRGYHVTVEVTAEGARVSHADCPTQDCVHTGTITRPGQSIVCLPARVVVTLSGAAADSGFDVAAG